jgi:hypothetical protein
MPIFTVVKVTESTRKAGIFTLSMETVTKFGPIVASTLYYMTGVKEAVTVGTVIDVPDLNAFTVEMREFKTKEGDVRICRWLVSKNVV